MTTLEKVRAKVIEAVPGIMELNDGCIISLSNDEGVDYTIFNELNGFYKGILVGGFIYPNGFAGPQWIEVGLLQSHPNWFEIEGRPITLADVLRAMSNNNVWLDCKNDGKDGEDARLYFRKAPEGEWNMSIAWNLALPLDEQEPEVLEFLAKILGV